MIVWVDVETTGLDPSKGDLLEVGLVATDDKLNPVSKTSVLMHEPVSYEDIHPDVRAMHAASGLFLACEARGSDLVACEAFLCCWIDRLGCEEPPPMAGSTVSFDRAWLKAKMPRLESKFHYRNIDVSTLKELNKRFGWVPEWEGDRDTHRALPDLEDSMNELQHYLGAFFPRMVIEAPRYASPYCDEATDSGHSSSAGLG